MLSIIDKENAYNNFTLEVNSKVRQIDAIKSDSNLFGMQKKLLDEFLVYIPLPDCVCGFVKGKNYLDFLEVHCGQDFFLRIDIKNFFPSVKDHKVKEVLNEYIKISDLTIKNKILNDIVEIVTLNGSLPQGAVTSPLISNILFRRLDIRIRNYCRKFNVEFTRYADDMLFSSNNEKLHSAFFVKMISRILREHQLEINRKKTRKSKNKIILNGYVISKKISLSRKKLSKVNTLIYNFENVNGKKRFPINFSEYNDRIAHVERCYFHSIRYSDLDTKKKILINYLAGYRSYLLTFSNEKYKDACVDYSKKIKKIEGILEKLTYLNIE